MPRTSRWTMIVAVLVGASACTDGNPAPATSASSPPITRPTVVVPNIVGMTTMDALHTLREAGLLFVVNRTMPVRDDNTVLEQLPEQGAEVPFLSVVVATADCHPQPCSGPAGQGLIDPCTCVFG